ncbi:MAG: TonB-dependent receptor [Bacteroidales bacterium]|nr:TonB-dependent receptor [Bacteroidales bacterium]
MKKSIYLTAALPVLLMCGSQEAFSQNLDPTVEVSRAYVAKKMEVNKSSIKMAVPDSVMKFDLDFDYSVNDNPYRGSYEFRPYVLDMRPESQVLDGNTFFLRAGAGYSLHPTLDLVYSPRFSKVPFTMSIYGTHRSYVGKYRGVSSWEEYRLVPEIYLPECPLKRDRTSSYSGYNSYTSAGVNGRTDWKTGFFSFDVGYVGYADKDTMRTRGYDAVKADFRVAANRTDDRYFFYDVALSYQFGEDKIKLADKPLYHDGYGGINGGYGLNQYVGEHDFSLKATLGPVFTQKQRVLMDVVADVASYGGSLSAVAGKFSFTPKYQLFTGRWKFDLGVKVSVLFGEDKLGTSINATRGQFVYPDVEIGFDAIKGHMNIYLKADGGEDINRYSDMIARNWHFSQFYSTSCFDYLGKPTPLLDNTVERVKAVLGFRGSISSKFSYDLRGGYANYKNLACDAAVLCPYEYIMDEWGKPSIGQPLSAGCIRYSKCNYYFAAFDMKWNSQDVTADMSLKYCATDLEKRQSQAISPSPLTIDANVVYNWKRRIYAGVHCNAALRRTGTYYSVLSKRNVITRVPGYADLGVSLEYKVNRKFSVWLYGGNLLDMTIQRVPMYAEGGISATAGITLSL